MIACGYCGGPHGYHAEADWNPYKLLYVCGDCRQRGITDWDALKIYSAAHPEDPALQRYRESEERDRQERARAEEAAE